MVENGTVSALLSSLAKEGFGDFAGPFQSLLRSEKEAVCKGGTDAPLTETFAAHLLGRFFFSLFSIVIQNKKVT